MVLRSQVLLALTAGRVVLLELSGASLVVKSEASMPHEVSCLSINPLVSEAGAAAPTALIAAVGLWTDNSVRLLGLVRFWLHLHLRMHPV